MKHIDFDKLEIPISKVTGIIDEHIFSERNRKILKRRYIDGIGFEKLAAEFDLTTKQITNIIYKYEAIIMKYI